MRDSLSVGIAEELAAAFVQLLAQLAEVFDDAVVHDRKQIGGVRMGVVLSRPPMCRPARMTNSDRAFQRFTLEPCFERTQLAFSAAAAEHALLKRGHARRVIAAVFEALERIDQLAGDRRVSENSDDPAHPSG